MEANNLALKQLDEELAILRAQKKLQKKIRGMDFYAPNPMQEKAHKCGARTICYVGGNRAGKSTFGAMELCYHLTRNYPEWYPEEKRFSGPIKAVISATSYAIVMRVVAPKLTELLPKDYYSIKNTSQGFPTRLRCKDGSTVDILTLEMDDSQYESADWDFAWLDEPQNQRKFYAIQRGLVDRGGRMVLTFTPLTEPWMKDEIVDKEDGKRIAVFTVDIRDNKFTVKGEPILKEEFIEEFQQGMPDDYIEARIHGKFFHLRGAIYQEFSEAHQRDFKYEGQPVIAVLDPHDRVPHHIIWAFIDRDDTIFVDYEYEAHIDLPILADRILAIEKERGYHMKRRLIDPNFGRKPFKVGSNINVIKELARNGVGFYEANDDVELGHMIVRDYLHYDKRKEISVTNEPKIFFARDRVPKTIKSVRNLQYEEWDGKRAGDRDPKEVEKDKENHGADCIRYLCISKPRYSFGAVVNEELSVPAY